MVSESGAVLLDDEARAAIVTELLPLATVITPNLPEARVLASGAGPTSRPGAASSEGDDVEDLARALHALGPEYVVVTGGHRDAVVDVFFDGSAIELLAGERHPDGAAHGSGCTHSSSIAAHLALGFTPLEAARAARAIARRRRSATGTARSAAGPARSTRSASASGDGLRAERPRRA